MRGCQLASEVPGDYEGAQALNSCYGGKAPNLESGNFHSSPSVGTSWLCDLGLILDCSEPQFSHVEHGGGPGGGRLWEMALHALPVGVGTRTLVWRVVGSWVWTLEPAVTSGDVS